MEAELAHQIATLLTTPTPNLTPRTTCEDNLCPVATGAAGTLQGHHAVIVRQCCGHGSRSECTHHQIVAVYNTPSSAHSLK